ncbi:HAD family hydrolase [Terrarubrum flagellatum]|uniref:HAD family hydrolase n=1 Tax=Terrirubrum flagellatum TaxID=2895980 RepID=UPI003144FB65
MLLIFDCDGVLVDSEVIACAAVSDHLALLGAAMSAAEVGERFVGVSSKDMMAALIQQFGARIPEDFRSALQLRTLALLASDLQPIPGVRMAIEALPHRRCVASSSTIERISLSLATARLADLFEPAHIFSSYMVKHGKPAPDIFLHAAREMQTQPGECVVIEDSVAGVTGASAAGMRVIGFTGGSHLVDKSAHAEKLRAAGAHIVIDDMRDLAAHVG